MTWDIFDAEEPKRTAFPDRSKRFLHFALLRATSPHFAFRTLRMKTMSEDVATYATNGILLKDFERFWPKGHAVPQMILDVAALIGPWPWGIVSHFYIIASRPNDYGIENGADLWNEFGMFVGIANGTEYALWYYDGCPLGAEPVVSFGDEGDLRILAPNLKAFFAEWGAGRGVGMLDPFDYDATPELLAERKTYGDQVLQLLEKYPDPPISDEVPDFEKYINDFAAKARARNAADPTLRAMAKLLTKYIPAPGTNSRGKTLKLKAVGDTVEIETQLMEPDYTEMEPLPEREALVPLVLQARLERAAAQNDGRGLWTGGVLYLLEDGHLFVSGDWG
jgi:hypothetical protein